MREVDVDDPAIVAVEKAAVTILRVVDELMRQHKVAGGRAPDTAHRRHGQDRRCPARLYRPDVGPVIDAVRRNGVPMTVTGQKYRVPARDLPEQQRRRRFSVGRTDDFAMGDCERGQTGQAASAYDREHETCFIGRFRQELASPGPPRMIRRGSADVFGTRGGTPRQFMTLSWKPASGRDAPSRSRRGAIVARGARHVPRPTVQTDG